MLLDPESASEVCNTFGIQQKMTSGEESKALESWTQYCDQKKKSKLHKILKLFRSFLSNEGEPSILPTALMLIGCWTILRKTSSVSTDLHSEAPSDAVVNPGGALTLVLRASVLGELPVCSETISVERALSLIENAVYFRCTSPTEADAKEQELGITMTNEPPSSYDGNPDVYVRLDIENGKGLLGATSRFALKNGLRDRPVGTIRLVRQAVWIGSSKAWRDFHTI